MTSAEFAGRGALAMFWFQAASVARDDARGESDEGGAGKTTHEPSSPDGATPGAALAGPAARRGTEAASATTSAAASASPARPGCPPPVRSQVCADSQLADLEVVDDELLDFDAAECRFFDLQALDHEAADGEAADRHGAEG